MTASKYFVEGVAASRTEPAVHCRGRCPGCIREASGCSSRAWTWIVRDGGQGGGHLRRQFAVRMFLHVHQLCCMQTPQQVGYIRAICLSPVHAQCAMHCAQGPHYAVSAYGASCRGCSTRLLRIFPRGSLRHGVVWCTIQRAAALSDDGASPDVCIGWGLCVLLPGLQACMRCVLCWSFTHWWHVTCTCMHLLLAASTCM